MNKIPTKVFLTKGIGRHRKKLTSFEMALRDAKVSQFNLVKVSSIIPPECKIVSREAGLKLMKPGQIVYAVISENATNEPSRLLAASIGMANPKNIKIHGYLSEHHGFGETDEKTGEYAEDLAVYMLATTFGEVQEDAKYDKKRGHWKLGEQVVLTRNITQSATVDRTGMWTSVVALAVFCG